MPVLYALDANVQRQKISGLRDALDGLGDIAQGISLNGQANLVPTGWEWAGLRTHCTAGLEDLYFAPDAARGGFFPNGIKFGNDEVTNSAGSFRSERLAI